MPDSNDHEARIRVLESAVKLMREDLRSDIKDLGKTMREGFKTIAADSRREYQRVSTSLDELSETVTQGRIADAEQGQEIATLKSELGGYRQKLETLGDVKPAAAGAPATSDGKRNAAIATALIAAAGAIATAFTASGG